MASRWASDDAALAAAVKSARLEDKVKVIGFDGMEEARNAVDTNPVMVGVIQKFPAEIGKTAVHTAATVISGQDMPAEQPIVPGVHTRKQQATRRDRLLAEELPAPCPQKKSPE